MRILGIKINNYKSFSNKNNILRFDFENTLGLIGKNESGKSNTLLALKELLFFDSSLNPSIFNDYNRLTNEPVDVSLEVEFDENDFDFENKLFFVNETYGNTIENLLSKNVKKNIDVGSKTLNAKKFAMLINKDDSFLDEETILNFENLFIKIGMGEFGGSDK